METISCPWEPARYFMFSSNVPQILYYALVPGMLIALLLSFFVLFGKSKTLSSILLFFISLSFFIWGVFDLILFATNNPRTVILLWSFTILVELMIYAGSLYLSYAFFSEEDISFVKKVVIVVLLLPFIILLPTEYNLVGVNLGDCTAIEGPVALYFSYTVEVIFSLWILLLAVHRYRKTSDSVRKKKIVLFSFGILFFLLSFSSGNIIGSFTDDWVTSQYGYFGMPIFMAFLAYLIVRYKAFNIKFLAVQALVIAIIILIGSQYFFIRNFTNKILTGVTLALAVAGGWVLIQSVKLEVKRKEELQDMATKLSSANEQLRKLDNAKSEFISIASHQLRTPPTPIKGYTSMLLEGSYGPLTPIQKDVLNKVYRANERMIQLVEDLLNLSRIEAGRMDYKYEKFKMEDLCQEIFDTFIIRAKEKQLALIWEEPETPLPEVNSDRLKIREVISNLVDNAIKYTPKGSVIIRAKQEGDKIQILVKDTGIGVPESEMPYLFAKFSRGKETNRLNVAGTGLGLHVGKKIIEALGGRLWVESEGEGKGSTFGVEVGVEHF